MANNGLNLHPHVWLPLEGASHTVVALHGTGGDEHDLVPLVREIYPDSQILGVRGNVNEGGAARFFRRYTEGMFDEEDIENRMSELDAFWQAAVEAYGLNAASTTWLGYSNGANMIAAMLLRREIVRDALLLRAQMPFQAMPEGKVVMPARVSIRSGAYDTIVPVRESKRLRDALMLRGHNVEQRFVETGHQLSRMDLQL